MPLMFDMHLRAGRRDRAFRMGADFFLHERAFADCFERIELMQRRFSRALLVGCPDTTWPRRLGALADQVSVVEPGPLFAATAGGTVVIEDRIAAHADAFDLIVAIGTLDTVDDLPAALRALASSLAPDGLMIGAMSGGDTVPQLRAAMHAADRVSGGARPHVHPRIEPSALVHLLSNAGLSRPVVDIDRVKVSYASLGRLVGDLRAMAATSILAERAPEPLSRSEHAAACTAFANAGANGKTVETFEILHFAGWRGGADRSTSASGR
ncbi:MAG: methyltransferase domain-containing protein [Pseudomonadota bacterium]